MRVWLDPGKVAARGLTASDVVNAIREQNVQVAAGVVGAPPMPVPVDYQLTVNARGRLLDEKEFGDIILKTGADGEITRLRDVARLELGAGDYALRSLLDNKDAVAIGIFQAPGSNALQLSSTVRKTMEELKLNFPEGVEYRIVYDPTIIVRDGIREVVKTLFEAILLVVIVVVLFLQTWRASIIPLVAVPISIVGTFAIMLGVRLLDQHAVAVRAGARHRHRGRRRDRRGRERRAQHRGGALAARRLATRRWRRSAARSSPSRLVLCAVFVPVAFISGLTGEFYRQFALTIAFSTVISAFNSLTLCPALSAILLKSREAPPDRLTRVLDRTLGWLFRPFNRAFKRGSERYGSAVARVIRRGGIALAVYAGLVALTVFGFNKVPHGLRADAGQAVPGGVRAAARRGDARPHRRGSSGRWPTSPSSSRASRTPCSSPGSPSTASSTRRTPASSSSPSSRSTSDTGRRSTA